MTSKHHLACVALLAVASTACLNDDHRGYYDGPTLLESVDCSGLVQPLIALPESHPTFSIAPDDENTGLECEAAMPNNSCEALFEADCAVVSEAPSTEPHSFKLLLTEDGLAYATALDVRWLDPTCDESVLRLENAPVELNRDDPPGIFAFAFNPVDDDTVCEGVLLTSFLPDRAEETVEAFIRIRAQVGRDDVDVDVDGGSP